MKFLLFISCAFFIFTTAPQSSIASHWLGGDITYQYVTSNQYLIKVRGYNNCAGIGPPDSVLVCYHSLQNNFSSTISLPLYTVPVELPPNPNLPPVISSCNGGTGFGVKRCEYLGMLHLPFAADDWELSYTTPFIPSIPTIISPPAFGFFFSTKIDNLNHPVNSSIQFTYDPTFQFCIGQPAWELFGGTDPDGDSLHFSIIQTLIDTLICAPQPFVPPFNYSVHSVSSSTPLYLHPTDGWVHFTPIYIQVAYLSVKVEEFRNGQLINETYTTHSIIIVASCISTGMQDNLTSIVKLYPNPASNTITIETGGITEFEVLSVSSVTGESLQPVRANTFNQIDISKYPGGFYFLMIKIENVVIRKWFLKH